MVGGVQMQSSSIAFCSAIWWSILMATKYKNLTNAGKGRRPGVGNKINTAAKDAFALAFEGMGGVKGLIEWGRRNRTEFYKLYSKLIPADALMAAGPLVNISLGSEPIRTAAEAEAAYKAILGDPTFDFTQISFEAPATSHALITTGPAIAPLRDATATVELPLVPRIEPIDRNDADHWEALAK
jgi:hypothetical protein